MACINGIDSVTGLPCGGGPTGSTGATGNTGSANPFVVPTYSINPTISRYRAETDRLRYELALKEYEAEQKRLSDELARKTLGATQQQKYYEGLLSDPTKLRAGTEDYLGLLKEYQGQAETAITDQYDVIGKALEKAYNAGVTLSTTGFDALKSYLNTNQPIAFRQAQRATAQPQINLIEQYARARGIATPGVEQAVQEANVLASGGAQNYNNLLTVLQQLGERAQTSRLSEAQMAGTVSQANLANRLLSGQTQLGTQRASALAQILNQYNAARLQAERDVLQRKQTLEDALAALRASGLLPADKKEENKKEEDKKVVTPEEIAKAIAANPTLNPGNVAAALAQGVTPQYLEDRTSGSAGNPLFGALDRNLYAV
jgi:hypothetical protein